MATKYKYDKDTDYAALMERAAQRGDNAAAAIYEQQRNAKIRGEGMTDVTQSNDYAQYLPLEDVPDYDDTHRRQAESLLTERDTTGQRARIDQMLDALLGEEFDYDPASDKLYAAYRQQYERQADLASANALGAAAALTGGRASTAAVAAAQQAGGYYRAMLAGKLPELAQLAYERYNGERKTRLSAIDAMLDAADSRDGVMKAQIAALLDMDDADYDRADSKLQQQAKDAADRKAAADKKAKEEKAAQEAADKAARSEARRQITLILRNGGTVTAIGDLAFESCKALTAAPIHETVTEIGASAFTGCTALTDVNIPAGVSTIPEDCFRGCTALTDIDLPGTVTSVGHNAFTGCTALKDVRCYGAAPAVEPGNSEAHSFEPATVTIHYNPAMNWTLDADGKWQGYTVSDKGVCTHTDYGTTENTVPATCGKAGRVDTICSNCGEVVSTRELPPTGAHDWGNGVVTTAPTETTPGVRTFTCTVCGQTRTETIPATGAHDYRFTETIAPTCTDGGYDLYTCSGCGATERRNLTDAAGHKWDGGTVTTAPTETTPGVRTRTCTVCGDIREETIPATGASTCTGGPSCPSYGLRDVAGPGYWAHKGIDYCVRNRLMSGVGAGTFSPDTACTRAQIVKILYNRSGNQADYSYYYLPFTDVAPGAWYYNAVAWAYYNDVTSGTSATMFTPNAAITRQQLVTFLYRYTVKYAPEFTGNATPISAFPDAGSVANWAYAAMSWAVGNGLIVGNAHNGLDYLDPNGSATRAQTATIIMRYCQLIGA